MSTKNEKQISACILMILEELRESGIELSDKMQGVTEVLQAIISEEEKVGMPAEEKFYYGGVDVISKTEAERKALGICEFTVTYKGNIILRVYYDSTLNWVMQPIEKDGEITYIPVTKKKCPCQTAIRPTLKKYAEEELKHPGWYAEKFYVPMPEPVKRNAVA